METNDSAFDFNLYTDFWHNQRGPPFFPVVTSAPAPPSPPPSAPPPPPPNTMNGHKRHRVDCRKLSWEQLSPDVVNRDTIWKKVILPYWFHFTKFLWMLFNCFAKYTFTAWLSSLLLIEANSQTFVPGSILSCKKYLELKYSTFDLTLVRERRSYKIYATYPKSMARIIKERTLYHYS